MIKKINIFNYEAYYLDFLEGNLSSEDEMLLLDFLEEHPECKMEDDELPQFEAPGVSLGDTSFLKETGDNDAISPSNIDHFLIAEAEGILEPNKQDELNDFLKDNPSYDKDRKQVAAVYFEPDTSIVLNDKSELKRRKTIVLWPYVASAAAAVIAAVFFLYQPDQTTGSISIADNETEPQNVTDVKMPANNFDLAAEQGSEAAVSTFTADAETLGMTQPSVNKNNIRNTNSEELISPRLEKAPARPIVAAFNDADLKPVTTIPPHLTEKQKNNSDFAYIDFKQMKNPIEPITKLISDKTKTEVDFRKEDSPKAKGFYLKIGKFEVSRRKH